jgi:hypothetical protein
MTSTTTPTIERVTLIRDMPDRTRIVAKLEVRHEGARLSPGFSLTGEVYEPRGNWPGATRHDRGLDSDLGGCIHAEILRAFPQLAPFARLHLSDPSGVDMHAYANARYRLFDPRCWDYSTEHGYYRDAEGPTRGDYLRTLAVDVGYAASSLRCTLDDLLPLGTEEAFAEWFDAQRDRWAREASEALALFRELQAAQD